MNQYLAERAEWIVS